MLARYANTSSYLRSQKRLFRNSRRTKFSRKRGLKQTIHRVLNKQVETKFLDFGVENLQLYHNYGFSVVDPTTPTVAQSISSFSTRGNLFSRTLDAKRALVTRSILLA